MSKRCDLTGVGVMSGHNVSHSNRKTKRTFVPNLKKKSIKSDVLGSNITLTITSKTLKTITKYGSLDAFLVNFKYAKLTNLAKKLRKKVTKALIDKGLLEKVKVKKETKRKKASARKTKVASKKKAAKKVEKKTEKKVVKKKTEDKKEK